MVPILSNKNVFEPSYNDFKLMVQNHNYICTNLISSLTKTDIKLEITDKRKTLDYLETTQHISK